MKTYIVSIVEIDSDAPPALQHLEVFKSVVYPEAELATENEGAAELGKRVAYITDLVLGNVTMDVEGEAS